MVQCPPSLTAPDNICLPPQWCPGKICHPALVLPACAGMQRPPSWPSPGYLKVPHLGKLTYLGLGASLETERSGGTQAISASSSVGTQAGHPRPSRILSRQSAGVTLPKDPSSPPPDILGPGRFQKWGTQSHTPPLPHCENFTYSQRLLVHVPSRAQKAVTYRCLCPTRSPGLPASD